MTLDVLRTQLAGAVAACPAGQLAELAGLLEQAKVQVLTRALSPAPQTTDVVDVATLAAELDVAESWLRTQARTSKLPHIRAGKYIKFRRSEVLLALGRPGTDHRMAAPVPTKKRSNGEGAVSACFHEKAGVARAD